MNSPTALKSRRRLRRATHRRRPLLALEGMEPRLLLSSTPEVLQGIVYNDANANHAVDPGEAQAGATVTLYLKSGAVYNQVTQQTTLADGIYSFGGLASGQYRVTESPPTGYTNSSTQASSKLDNVTATTGSSIDVTLGDSSPNNWLLSYPTNNKVEVQFTANGTSHDSLVGQLNVSNNETDVPYTTPTFQAFCVDLNRDIFTGDSNLPYTLESLTDGLNPPNTNANPANAGRIAYLYETYGTTTMPATGTLTSAQNAAAMQLAIWELEYEKNSTYDVTTGTFFATGGTNLANIEAQANNYISLSDGHSALAYYLNGVPNGKPNELTGAQGLIAPPGVFNFANAQGVTIGDFVWNDTNANGVQDAGEPGIPGVTLTLTGTASAGGSVTGTTTTDASGHYLFTEVPGTYTVSVAPPAGYTPTVTGQGTTSTDSNASPSGTTPGTLPGGGSDQTIDFGFYQPVTVGNFVWDDSNGNGVQDSGEPGIPGVTLTLMGTTGAGASITQTTTTDANGLYQFTEPPGTYTVAVTTPSGYVPTVTGQGTTSTDSNASPSGTTPGTLPGGGSDQTIDFGFYQPVTVGNFVWDDTNGNGVQDSGEPGIPGVTLTLMGTTGAGASVTQTTSTDANGLYQFTEPPGTYTVAVTTPSGYVPTVTGQGTTSTDSNASPSGTTPGTLPGGGSDQTIDFGFYQPVTVGNFVWNDSNGNGIQDGGEPGIPGVTLTLMGTTGAGASVTQTTTTDANGLYQFTEPPGTYTVAVTTPSGYAPTVTGQGTTSTDSNASPSGTTPGTLPGGGSDQTIDFGFYQPVTVGNFVWDDSNGNGVQDAGEPGIPGVTLTLMGTTGAGASVTQTTTTDANGLYQFTEPPGTYTVAVTTPSGYTPTVTGQGTTATDSNPSPSGTTPGTLPGGGSDQTIDFGFYQPVTVGNFVWDDSNGNGVQDAGEPGIPGVTLTLMGTTGSGASVTQTTTTDANGLYQFAEPPGTYTVAVTTPSGYTPTATGKGAAATDSNPTPSGTTPGTLPGGGSDQTIDFGFYQPVTVGNFVWNDSNGNGIQDGGEPGIPGVTLTLMGTTGAGASVTQTTTTDANGLYQFTEPPGTYTVAVTTPSGYVPTVTGQGTTSTDSNPSPSGTTPGTLASGGSDQTVDFGFRQAFDLAITKTDGTTTYTPGGSTTYTIVVSNNGPSAVTGAAVNDALPAAITSDTWTAVASSALA